MVYFIVLTLFIFDIVSLLGAIHVVLQDNPRVSGFLWRICELLKLIFLWITNGLFLLFFVLAFLTRVLNIEIFSDMLFQITSQVQQLTEASFTRPPKHVQTKHVPKIILTYLVLGLIFAGYVPLASQSPYPIMCNFRDPNLVNFYFCISLINPLNRSSKNELTRHFRMKHNFTFHLQYINILVRLLIVNLLSYLKNPKMCALIIVNLVVRMRPHPAAHPTSPLASYMEVPPPPQTHTHTHGSFTHPN